MFGERLYQLRTHRGLSQAELASHLNKSKQSVSNWENDNILPSIDMLVALSKFFGVSCDYLLELDDRKYLEVTGLTEKELTHVQLIIDDIRKKYKPITNRNFCSL